MPSGELGRYTFERDPDSEQDIARYVEMEADRENVQHVERVKSEFGIEHVVWDVTTDKDRYWVITELRNLYSQRQADRPDGRQTPVRAQHSDGALRTVSLCGRRHGRLQLMRMSLDSANRVGRDS